MLDFILSRIFSSRKYRKYKSAYYKITKYLYQSDPYEKVGLFHEQLPTQLSKISAITSSLHPKDLRNPLIEHFFPVLAL